MTPPEDKIVFLSEYVYKHRDEQTKTGALFLTKARQVLRHQLLCERALQQKKYLRLSRDENSKS